MLTQNPDIAGDRDRSLRRLRDCIVVGVPGVLLFRLLEQCFNFLIAEADDVQIEAVHLERLQFDPQHLLVPTGIHRQTIVCDDQRAALRFGEMVEDDDRDFGHPEFPGGKQARVARNDHSVRADEDWIRPPELGDAGAATCATCSSECVLALRM